jgi:hypothetical protein
MVACNQGNAHVYFMTFVSEEKGLIVAVGCMKKNEKRHRLFC